MSLIYFIVEKKCSVLSSSHFDPCFLHLETVENNNFLRQIYFDRKKICENKSRQFIQPFPYDNMNIFFIFTIDKKKKLANPLFHIIHSIQLLFILYPLG